MLSTLQLTITQNERKLGNSLTSVLDYELAR